ncbi:MAG: transcription termination/antitermination factor NusG [Verrucomicrobiae bacterium]|nr:transcription termination/antitermination factor NusG [Verrucomicrobiae bacterium]
MTSKISTQWYSLHVLSGQEQKVKESIEKRRILEEVSDIVHASVIPTEQVEEIKKGKRTTTSRKLFPGYVFVNMELYDDDQKLNERAWYFIQNTPGVIGFADGNKPIPMPPSEVEGMLSQMKDREDKILPKVIFERGETLNINDGPFKGLTGVVDEVDVDRGKLKVSVSIFGRSTPVELEFWQVEKA